MAIEIWEISGTSQMPGSLGNFKNYLGIWEIYKMPGYLENFPNA